jgi:hypothetical protein
MAQAPQVRSTISRRSACTSGAPVADGAENAAPDASSVEDCGDEIRRRCLAVRARDPDHPHLAAGIAVEGGGELSQREARVLDDRPRYLDLTGRLLFRDDRSSSEVDCLPGERRTVGVLSFERDEHMPRCNRA